MPKSVMGFPQPLVVFLASKVGIRKSVKVASFVVAWGQCAEKMGEQPNFRQYSEFWNQSEAQTYKELKLFHEVWPDDRTPKRVWDWCRSEVGATDRDVAVAQALDVDRRWS